MPPRLLHRFEREGKRYVVDPETCFCFECDEITWDVLALYPESPLNHVFHELEAKHPRKELEEVVGELEWLRASKSILSPPKLEQQQKAFELDRRLRRLEIHLDVNPAKTAAPATATSKQPGLLSISRWSAKRADASTSETAAPRQGIAPLIHRGAAMLLARGTAEEPLRLTLRWNDNTSHVEEVLDAAREAFSLATIAGKTLYIALACRAYGIGSLSSDNEVYTVLCTRADVLKAGAAALEVACGGRRVAAKAFSGLPEGAEGQVTIESRDGSFAEAAEVLHGAGLSVIEINLETPYASEKPPAAADVAREMERCAQSYSRALLKGDYYRLEPIAGLFHRIYLGMPAPRTDPAGLWTLASDATGAIYPSAAFFGRPGHLVGNLLDGTLDNERLKRYEDIGSVTTPACFHCWARHLCGGGNAATHEALSGDFRTPHASWCDAQRAWLEAAIAAFNLLSAEGTNFARLYGQLGRSAKVSLFTMVRAAFQMNLGLRPLGEADAELLTKWENFNDASYFTFNETGLLMATKYDREMDALHPTGREFEFLVLRKNGAPMGLLRVRPLPAPGTAMLWIYLRKASDYADESVQKSFRFLLGEAGKAQGLKHVVAPCGPFDAGLAQFLKATGFEPSGQQREALYLRGAYHDVAWYAAPLVA